MGTRSGNAGARIGFLFRRAGHEPIQGLVKIRKAGAFNPGARLVAPKQGTGKRLTPKEREKLRKQREKEERRLRREQRDKGKGNPGSPHPDRPNPGGPGR